MTRRPIPGGDGPARERRDGGTDRTDFEAAEREFFEDVGLEIRSHFYDLGTPPLRTRVIEAGPDDGDVPLVFVHGTAEFCGFFAPLMAEFDGAPLIAYDRPGFGLSEPFLYTRSNLRGTNVAVLEGVLDGMDAERVDLVGHSMGGYTSIHFALANPDRVRRLALVGSPPSFPGTVPPLPLRLMTVQLLGLLLERLQKSGEEGVLDFADVFGEHESIQAYPTLLRAMAAQQDDPAIARTIRDELESLFSVRGWHADVRTRESDLRRLEQPTLVIVGEDDPLGGPEALRDGVDAMPDASLEAMPTGHVPFFAYPERCAEILREFRDE